MLATKGKEKNTEYTVAVVTATRAEYGILYPLIKQIDIDPDVKLDLIVTGTHLSEKYGCTIDEIKKDGFLINHIIPILEDDNSAYGISVTMANCIKGFADCFRNDRPDMLVILGDRTEMLAVASAAMNEQIPIVHISGGEVTEGAVDDCIRHALTKMSYLHFANAEIYRRRVIQLGEDPKRVYNVGVLAIDNIKHGDMYSELEIRSFLGVRDNIPYVIVTLHPETVGDSNSENNAVELCKAMKAFKNYYFVITKTNSDAGGEIINNVFCEFTNRANNAVLIDNLGHRYLSALKYAEFIMGNSSSGMGEAPILGTPTINIGDRQKGREIQNTIISCGTSCDEIISAMKRVKNIERKPTSFFSGGDTAASMVSIIKDYLVKGKIDLKKGFFDIKF